MNPTAAFSSRSREDAHASATEVERRKEKFVITLGAMAAEMSSLERKLKQSEDVA